MILCIGTKIPKKEHDILGCDNGHIHPLNLLSVNKRYDKILISSSALLILRTGYDINLMYSIHSCMSQNCRVVVVKKCVRYEKICDLFKVFFSKVKYTQRGCIMKNKKTEITWEILKLYIHSDLVFSKMFDGLLQIRKHKLEKYQQIHVNTVQKLKVLSMKKEKNLLKEGDILLLTRYESLLCNIEMYMSELSKELFSNEYRSTVQKCLDSIEVHGREKYLNEISRTVFSILIQPKLITAINFNMCLMGSSGVGKTTFARVVGDVYRSFGLLIQSSVEVVTSSNLIGGFVGETSSKTRAVLLNSIENTLIIDEAYTLGYSSETSGYHGYKPDCITEILNFCDEFKGLSCICVIGYEHEMKTKFFPSNEGLQRRFFNCIIIKDLTVDEMTDIFLNKLKVISDIAIPKTKIQEFIQQLYDHKPEMLSKQAASVCDLVERFCIEHYSLTHFQDPDLSFEKYTRSFICE